jgi:hypothetical protein
MSTIGPIDKLSTYGARIGYLQRAELDEQKLSIPLNEIKTALSTLNAPLPSWLAEVRGIPHFGSVANPQEPAPDYFTREILAGLNGRRTPVYYLIRGEPNRIRLYIGTLTKEDGATVRAAFSSYYPGIKLLPEGELSDARDQEEQKRIIKQQQALDKELQQGLRPFINDCNYVGVVTGVPTPNVGEKSGAGTQLDRLIRGLYGTRWALLVLADPAEDQLIAGMQLAILREQLRIEEEEEFRERRESAGKSVAVYYHHLLEMQHQLLEGCLFEGGWWLQSYICSPDLATYRRAKGLVKGIFSGDFSRVDRIRLLDCFGAAPKAASFSSILVDRSPAPSPEFSSGTSRSFKYHTLVSSGQLSAFIHLPRVEMPGYYIQESASFDVSSHAPAEEESIEVGEILDRGRPTGNFYRVPLKQLTRHCLLVGITGSGKTTTSQHMLRQLQEQDPPIPFLVIEPAKREYREMASLLSPERKLRVFTVGEEHRESAPFRLNPFEIRRGVSVQTHIDLLKSVFNASFGMWSPLPQVLERAIHEIYRDKGWDTVQSDNHRATTDDDKSRWNPFAQPTLTDLFHKVGELVPRLGYDKEVERNVRTALETRINSLRIGAKGLMLDTRESIPIEHILAGPTVLELEGVGDDDEKAFIMGLILMAVYEYYRNPKRPPIPGRQEKETAKDQAAPWRHITVIEEAHRLLTNVPISTDPEATNLKGKAVETFVNMLSEVRAYGEGFIIAEQIPMKLAPDVIKNTALKIMQRTVAKDDREVMGGAMNLTESQLRRVVALDTGEAVIHGGGDDNALLVKVVPRPKVKGKGEGAIEGVRSRWKHFIEESKEDGLKEIFFSYPTCGSNCLSQYKDQLDRLPETQAICVSARRIAEDPAVEQAFAALILSLVAGSRSRGEDEIQKLIICLYPRVAEALSSCIAGPKEQVDQMRCTLTHALYRYLQRRGSQYGWKYSDVVEMTTQLLPAILTAAGCQISGEGTSSKLRAFCQYYGENCSLSFEPFYGCGRTCGQSPLCLYRYDVEPLLYEDYLDDSFSDAEPDDPEGLARICEEAAERALMIVGGSKKAEETPLKKTALCYLIQKTHANPANWPVENRKRAINQLLEFYGL